MNQIIYPENLSDNFKKYDEYIKSKKKVYKYIFILAIFFLMAFIGYYLWRYFKISKKENVANKILTVYDIQKLYAENKPIAVPSVISETGDTADILGIIEINKINLRYPILSKTTDEFLDYFGLSSKEDLPKIDILEEANNEDKDLFKSTYKEQV